VYGNILQRIDGTKPDLGIVRGLPDQTGKVSCPESPGEESLNRISDQNSIATDILEDILLKAVAQCSASAGADSTFNPELQPQAVLSQDVSGSSGGAARIFEPEELVRVLLLEIVSEVVDRFDPASARPRVTAVDRCPTTNSVQISTDDTTGDSRSRGPRRSWKRKRNYFLSAKPKSKKLKLECSDVSDLVACDGKLQAEARVVLQRIPDRVLRDLEGRTVDAILSELGE
jgi:hypothetical protein